MGFSSAHQDGLTYRALDGFLAGGDRPAGVRAEVLDSWRRSRDAGVDPDSTRLPPVRLDEAELRAYRAGHPLAAAMPVVRHLLGEVIDSDEELVVLADLSGLLLWVEGSSAVRNRASRMNFVAGAAWDERHAGTNAPGVALSTGRDVEIFAGEHFSRVVRPWSCAAAVIRDPATGALAGVLDVTWPRATAAPHARALVRSTAQAIEGELLAGALRRRARAEPRYLDRAGSASRRALLGPDGRILVATTEPALVGTGARAEPDGATVVLDDGRTYPAEPLGDGYRIVHLGGDRRSGSARKPAVLRALGTDEAGFDAGAGGGAIRLRHRFSEVAVLLALHPRGLTADQLTLLLLGELANAVTVRAEVSRLRRLLGGEMVRSRPYRFGTTVATDFGRVRRALRDGRIRAALRDYSGPLLPSSDAPGIRAERTDLEVQLRAALLSTRDPGLLRKWVEAPWGAADAEAWEVLAASLPVTSNTRASALARAAALNRALRS